MRRIVLFVFLICFMLDVRAQIVSCGKEFFVTQTGYGGGIISIASKHAAAIHFHFFADTSADTNFILVPNEVLMFKDVQGIKTRLYSSTRAAVLAGKIENHSLQICTDSDIVVHYSYPPASAEDATLLYPVSQQFKDTAAYFFVGSGTTGVEMLCGIIVSHHDSTKLEITPTASVGPYAANVPFVLTLNKGEIFSLANAMHDMSGSTIRILKAQSVHPITVSTSYTSSYLQFPWGNYSQGSRTCCADPIMEQNLPVSNYDTLYHFVPFMIAPGVDILRGQVEPPGVVRILSAADNNKIYVDGNQVARLNKGQMFDTVLLHPRIITSTYPIAVNQFSQSWASSYAPSTPGASPPYCCFGDPDQMWLNPLKMGIKESIFKSFFPIRAVPYYGVQGITTLTVVADDRPINITLNGTDISGNFKPFPANPKYRYLQMIVDNVDTHHLLSDKKVVAYVTTFIWQGGMSYALGDLQSAIVDTAIIKDIGICDTLTLYGRQWGTDFFWNTGDNGKQNVTVNDTGTYWVTSYAGTDCAMRQVTDTFHLFSIAFPPINDTTICTGDSIVLDAYQEYFSKYLWSTGAVSHAITVSVGVYTVTAGTESCKGISDTIVVNKVDPPHLQFLLPDDTVLCKGTSISVGTQQEGITYLWNNGATSCCISITEPGYYKVIGTSELCKEQSSDSIHVDFYGCESCFWVPNAFTPNADGLNDVFRVRTDCILTNFRMDIYNRWGQLVYTGTNINEGWDGSYNGTPAELDVYYYRVTAESVLGEKKQLGSTGDLTLIR